MRRKRKKKWVHWRKPVKPEAIESFWREYFAAHPDPGSNEEINELRRKYLGMIRKAGA